jgi:hypothetical protein
MDIDPRRTETSEAPKSCDGQLVRRNVTIRDEMMRDEFWDDTSETSIASFPGMSLELVEMELQIAVRAYFSISSFLLASYAAYELVVTTCTPKATFWHLRNSVSDGSDWQVTHAIFRTAAFIILRLVWSRELLQ